MVEAVAGRPPGSNAVDKDGFGAPGWNLARERIHQFDLPIARYPCNPKDLTAAHRDRDISQVRSEFAVRDRGQALDLQTFGALTARGRPLVTSGKLGADHHFGEGSC